MTTQLTLYATNKYTSKAYLLNIQSPPLTDLVGHVLTAFSAECYRDKSTRDPYLEVTNQLRDLISCLGCFGGNDDSWVLTNSEGKILVFGNDDSHTFITPHKIKRFSWRSFLKGMFEKEVQKEEVQPMATKLIKKRG